MTQVSPYTALNDQAALAIKEIDEAYRSGSIRDLEEMSAEVRSILTDASEGAGAPLVEHDPIHVGEPPDLSKMNKFVQGVIKDTAVMRRQMDALRAAAVNAFNVASVEIDRAKKQNQLVQGRYRTLELYSSDTDPTVVTFTENYASDDFLDIAAIDGVHANILVDTYLTLGRNGASEEVMRNAKVAISGDSNGFEGNFQEAIEASDGNYESVIFWAEAISSEGIENILDGAPSTFFEYSAFLVRDEDKESADGFGFKYFDPNTGKDVIWSDGPVVQTDEPSSEEGAGSGSTNADKLESTLHLNLKVTLKGLETVNSVTIVPYGLRGNINKPYLVRGIDTTDDGDVWTKIDVAPFWVSTNLSGDTLRSAADFYINNATITFPPRRISQMRIRIEQPHAMPTSLGHVFYEKDEERVEGPIPALNRLRDQFSRPPRLEDGVSEGREIMTGHKWGIGIKHLDIGQVSYAQSSTMISKPIPAPGEIDRVALDADIYVPGDFGEDGEWVQFYVSGDKGATWTEVSRITDPYREKPEVVVFNDPAPEGFRETGAVYVNTDEPVESIVVKTVLRRPNSLQWSTPMVRSYNVRMKMK